MKYFYVIMNPDKKGARETAEQVREFLTARGAVCLIGGGKKVEWQSEKHYTDSAMVPESTECVITLGGDGTLIQAARDLSGRNLPILGINRGTLGYLTQVSRTEDMESALLALYNDDYKLEERMMLSGNAFREGKEIYRDIALNEIVITRGEYLKMLQFQVFVNGEFLTEYRADGLIAATPTGSTAYNLSAGGPIIAPDSQMLVLTPICSHALNARSIVLSAEDRISIEIMGPEDISQAAVFDGDSAVQLLPGDRMELKRAEIKTILVKLKNLSFLDNLRNKMAGI
ncbi:NAD(+)/NADH kinase [Clostridium boliviensis]|uniref:NAD kinase n=1 Tax=Clostridium boliviensis TaxID=318465 RepID=A0ABU4GHQ9_9CLOT|nr:NAD(+)/NADH kinase [Clostridium boliviensis]MDW2797150.1 NAD(+)/NADH kinase [Clostridium boliviensis]